MLQGLSAHELLAASLSERSHHCTQLNTHLRGASDRAISRLYSLDCQGEANLGTSVAGGTAKPARDLFQCSRTEAHGEKKKPSAQNQAVHLDIQPQFLLVTTKALIALPSSSRIFFRMT